MDGSTGTNEIIGSGDAVPDQVLQDFRAVMPDTLTLITTYQCNAACKDCCFECTPQVRGRLSLEAMRTSIRRAAREFSGLQLVVFTGGECFLLKSDLFAAILEANRAGLKTRCVTNGYWGRTESHCAHIVSRLVESGITEINLSTGKDHQQWVPVSSVIRAARMLVEQGIVTVLTVEAETGSGECFDEISSDPSIRRIMRRPELFRLQRNSWMPFHSDSVRRTMAIDQNQLRSGCRQLFRNLTITPDREMSACCGLTMEHIPEMKLGTIHQDRSLSSQYFGQLNVFWKVWINVDGPYRIIERLLGDRAVEEMGPIVHICEACAILHQDQRIRQALAARYHEFLPEVMGRFCLDKSLELAAEGPCSSKGVI